MKKRFNTDDCAILLNISTTAVAELKKKCEMRYVGIYEMMLLIDLVNQIRRSQGSVTTSTINAWLKYKECEQNELQRTI